METRAAFQAFCDPQATGGAEGFAFRASYWKLLTITCYEDTIVHDNMQALGCQISGFWVVGVLGIEVSGVQGLGVGALRSVPALTEPGVL